MMVVGVAGAGGLRVRERQQRLEIEKEKWPAEHAKNQY